MHTPTLAPPGWYEDASRPGQPRFWDGYQFPDEHVTICPAGHQAPMSAMFCPQCGQVPGPTRVTTLTGQDRRPEGRAAAAAAAGAGRPGATRSPTRGQAPTGSAMPGRVRRRWTATLRLVTDALTRNAPAAASSPAPTASGPGQRTPLAWERRDETGTARRDVAWGGRLERVEAPFKDAAGDAGQGPGDMNDRRGVQVPAQWEHPEPAERNGQVSLQHDSDGVPDPSAEGPLCAHVRHAHFAGARHGLAAADDPDHDESWQPCPRATSDQRDDGRR